MHLSGSSQRIGDDPRYERDLSAFRKRSGIARAHRHRAFPPPPSIALGEYRFGLRASRLRVELDRRLAALESRSVVLSVDSATSHPYADIRQELKIAGTPIPVNDLWIAALARQHSLPILSDDAHFDAVSGIQRFGW